MFPSVITNILPTIAIANVYDLLNILYVPTIIFGMTPFVKRKVKGRYQFTLMHGYWRYTYSSYNTLLLLTLAVTSIMFRDFKDTIFYLLTTTIAVLALNVYSFRCHELLNAMDLVDNAENTMKSLRIDLKYGLPICGMILQIIIGSLGITSLLIIHYLTGDVLSFFWELLSFGYPSFIMLLPSMMSFPLSCTILARFRTMNEFLKERTKSVRTSVDEINKLADVHYQLCEAFNKAMYSCGLSAIAAYYYIFLQIIFILYYAYRNDIHFSLTENLDFLFWNIAYTTCVSIGMPSMTYIKYVSLKTSRLLCQLVSPFTDDDIGTQRNTFLLQLLHQKIDLKVFGHFDLHLNRILPDVQVFVGLLIFFLQISGMTQDSKQEG